MQVTIDVFSGRSNPSVLLDDEQTARILPGLRPSEPLSAEDPSGPPIVLGYRGLVFEQRGTQEPSLPSVFRLVRGRLYGMGLRHWATDRDIEQSVLTDGGVIAAAISDPSTVAAIETEFRREHPPPGRAAEDEEDSGAPPLQACDSASPEPDLAWWNDADEDGLLCTGSTGSWRCQCNNNCYNYATNIRTDTFAQPGRGSGRQIGAMDCNSLRQAAFYDNVMDAPYADNRCVPGNALIAGVIWPNRDFHWYRKNQDGYWTHKPGQTRATSYDNSGHLIADPRTCDRGAYTEFCGFMVVTAGHPRIS
jgi:hypothetical protein